jgi:uncharacterized RDD family membrane protein YckC
VGLLCCGSLDAAIRAIAVSEFHEFGRKVDYRAFADQYAELQADSVSRWGAWLGGDPYATTRIAALRQFMASPQFAAAQAWFEREHGEEPPALAGPGSTAVSYRDCAGWWRRFAAGTIDAVVVLAIINSFGGQTASEAPVTVHASESKPHPGASPHATAHPTVTPSDVPQRFGPFVIDEKHRPTISILGLTFTPNTLNPNTGSGKTVWFSVYMAVLVTFAGQSFGMMITGLRVITVDFRRPGIWQTILRYAIVLALWWLIIGLSLIWRRVLLHDRWTRTRLVKVERVVARATGTE